MAVTQGMPSTRRRTVFGVVFKLGTYLGLLLVIGPGSVDPDRRGGPGGAALAVERADHQHQGTGGGLKNAIIGTLILMVGVLIIAGTIGVLAGIHLAELARPRRNGKASGGLLRTASDVLSGFPSIVLGYVGYVALVVGLHWGFSLLPALIILSIMVIPYIAKTTESALRQVPDNYREGAAGARDVHGVLAAQGRAQDGAARHRHRTAARPGHRQRGDGPSDLHGRFLQLGPAQPHPLRGFPYLTYPVFTFYNQPSNEAHYLAYDAALILVIIVLVLLVASRIIVARTQRHSESRGR